jgi:uncharacterized membrane protein
MKRALIFIVLGVVLQLTLSGIVDSIGTPSARRVYDFYNYIILPGIVLVIVVIEEYRRRKKSDKEGEEDGIC